MFIALHIQHLIYFIFKYLAFNNKNYEKLDVNTTISMKCYFYLKLNVSFVFLRVQYETKYIVSKINLNFDGHSHIP